MTEREHLVLEYKSLARLINNDVILRETAQRRIAVNHLRRVQAGDGIKQIDVMKKRTDAMRTLNVLA